MGMKNSLRYFMLNDSETGELIGHLVIPAKRFDYNIFNGDEAFKNIINEYAVSKYYYSLLSKDGIFRNYKITEISPSEVMISSLSIKEYEMVCKSLNIIDKDIKLDDE